MSSHDTTPKTRDLAVVARGRKTVIAVSPDVAVYGRTNVRPPDDGALLGLGIEEDEGAKVP